MSEKFIDIITAENFIAINVEELKYLLCLKKKKVESEEKVYEVVIGWIKHDNDIINREKHAEELFSLLKFSVMPSEFLSKVVAKETILRSSLVVMQAVLSAIGNHQPQKSAQEEQNKKHYKKSPSQKENRMPDLPLSGFLAADQSAIW